MIQLEILHECVYLEKLWKELINDEGKFGGRVVVFLVFRHGQLEMGKLFLNEELVSFICLYCSRLHEILHSWNTNMKTR